MAILGFLFGVSIYVFACYCMKLICEKSGSEAGVLVWIPILQVIPMLKAAKMNPLWIIGLLVPLLNIIVAVVLWVKLCEARGKASWLGVLSLVPIANLGLILYLAFSD